jgi:hypothetical protein
MIMKCDVGLLVWMNSGDHEFAIEICGCVK